MFFHIFKYRNTVLLEAPTWFGPAQSDSEKAQLEFISPKKMCLHFVNVILDSSFKRMCFSILNKCSDALYIWHKSYIPYIKTLNQIKGFWKATELLDILYLFMHIKKLYAYSFDYNYYYYMHYISR